MHTASTVRWTSLGGLLHTEILVIITMFVGLFCHTQRLAQDRSVHHRWLAVLHRSACFREAWGSPIDRILLKNDAFRTLNTITSTTN